VGKVAITTLLDFAAACPSVLHNWLFDVLAAVKIPEGLDCLIRNRYKTCKAFLLRDGVESWLFEVKSGVLQGCPLSAALFLLAIDPLLWLFGTAIVKHQLCTVCACADDIAITLRNMADLEMVEKIFQFFAKVAGLLLAPHKCIIILLSIASSDNNKHTIRTWLSQNIPAWQEMAIANSGVYLGFLFRP